MYETYISIQVQSSKTMENGEWEMKLRRDKADTNKQDQEEKGEKVYSCAYDNINLWWTQLQCCCWTDMEFSHWSITRYWTANHRSADTDNQSHVQLYSTFLCTIYKTFICNPIDSQYWYTDIANIQLNYWLSTTSNCSSFLKTHKAHMSFGSLRSSWTSAVFSVLLALMSSSPAVFREAMLGVWY